MSLQRAGAGDEFAKHAAASKLLELWQNVETSADLICRSGLTEREQLVWLLGEVEATQTVAVTQLLVCPNLQFRRTVCQ